MRTGRVAALSDTGRRRLRNEDAYVCDAPLFAVADGMGGAQAGELASRLAAAALGERERGSRGEEAVAELIQVANARVYRRALEDPTAAGMGTTTTVVLVDDEAGTLAVGHVGDSRAYRLRAGELEQLTRDHSLVQELVDSGRLTPEQAADHPHRSVITRALGTEASVDVDTFTVEALSGDLYLVCSDGLTTMVDDEQILALVEGARREPEAVARALVEAANRAGGEDNVTVVVFELQEGDPQARAPEGGPDEPTVESVLVPQHEPVAPVPVEAHVRRHGAGGGGRVLALAGIVAGLAVAAFLVWWGLGR